MNKIPHKVRECISIGLFLYSIFGVALTVILYNHYLKIWMLIVGMLISVFAFVLAVILMPRQSNNENEVKIKKPNKQKATKHKANKIKKPFISDKEWKELDEEDEEEMYLS